jgi:hypothetical protein
VVYGNTFYAPRWIGLNGPPCNKTEKRNIDRKTMLEGRDEGPRKPEK